MDNSNLSASELKVKFSGRKWVFDNPRNAKSVVFGRQRREMFVLEYMKDLNALQASRRAGYKGTAHKMLLNDAYVKKRLETEFARRAETVMVDAYYILDNLKTVCEKAMEGQVTYDGEGGRRTTYDFSSAVKALELLGRHIGMFGKNESGGSNHYTFAQIIKVVNNEINGKSETLSISHDEAIPAESNSLPD